MMASVESQDLGKLASTRQVRFSLIISTLVVLIAEILGTFLSPANYDDGWYMLTLDAAPKLGGFSPVIDQGANLYPSQDFWYSLLQLTNDQSPLWTYTVPILFCVATWLVLFQIITSIWDWSAELVVVSTAAYVAFIVLLFTVNLRSDVALAFGFSLALLGGVHTGRGETSWWLPLSILGAFIATAAHPVGLIVFAVPILGTVGMPRATRLRVLRQLAWRDGLVLLATLVAGALFVLWGRTPEEALQAYQSFNNASDHSFPWTGESFRYHYAAIHIGAYSMACIVAGCVALIVRRAELRISDQWVLLGFVCAFPIWLMFFPSKWHVYLVIFAIPSVLGWAGLVTLRGRKARTTARYLAVIILVATLLYPGNGGFSTNPAELVGIPNDWVRVGLAIAACLLLFFSSKGKAVAVLTVAIAGATLASAGASFRMVKIVTDPASGWSKYNGLMGLNDDPEGPMSGLSKLRRAIGKRDTVIVAPPSAGVISPLSSSNIWTARDKKIPTYSIGADWERYYAPTATRLGLPKLTAQPTDWSLKLDGTSIPIVQLSPSSSNSTH